MLKNATFHEVAQSYDWLIEDVTAYIIHRFDCAVRHQSNPPEAVKPAASMHVYQLFHWYIITVVL